MTTQKTENTHTENSVFVTKSAEETLEVGKAIANLLKDGDTIFLLGDLGSGKTTLMKGLIEELTGTTQAEIISPTFTYLHTYTGEKTIHHFDLYRLSSPKDFINAGFLDFLSTDEICCIEWPDRVPSEVKETLRIEIDYLSEQTRKITLYQRHANAT